MKFLCVLFLIHSLFAEEALLDSGQIHYSVRVGSIPCRDKQGREQGSIYYTYYHKEEPSPITFVFNGGPGCSSVWLHLGAFGPRRIASTSEGQTVLPPYRLIDNKDSILDLTDLVFIDPIGTGLSRASEEAQQDGRYYGVEEDIAAIGDFICDFITKEGRWNSPKYIAGESYGGIRAAGLSDYLIDEYGMFLHGLILISPALEYKTLCFDIDNELPYFLFLPTYAATAWAHGRLQGISLEETAQLAKDFALGKYASALFQQGTIPSSLYEEIAAWTGLPYAAVANAGGLIDDDLFLTQFSADQKLLIGRYDTRMAGATPTPRTSGPSEEEDPSASEIYGPLVGGWHAYLQDELHYQEDFPRYTALSLEVHGRWKMGDGCPNILPRLRSALVQNPRMKLFAACGYFDLAAPFGTVEYSLNKLHLPHVDLTFGYYEGGHMFYANLDALEKFKHDLTRFFKPDK